MTKTFFTIIAFFVVVFNASAQQKDLIKITDSIEAEGRMLYASEWASWYGSDIFMEKCPAKRDQLGGFLSYDSGKGMINILFTKGETPTVLGAVNFGYDHDQTKYQLDTIVRKLNKKETELFKIRWATIKRMGTDTIFKLYNGADLNPVPMIINGEKRVYVLTGPKVHGVVLFGNDYLVKLDKKDEVKSVEKLHKGLIPINYKTENGQVIVAGIHSHLDEYSPYITATDICTLMLYEKMTTWNQHIVTTKNFVSIWDCKKDKLAILTQEAWKKINAAKSALTGGAQN